MDQAYEQKYHELEAIEWWFVTRREAILKFMPEFSDKSKVLDVGCSSGHLLKDLKKIGYQEHQLFGIDVSETGVQTAQSLGFKQTEIMDGSDITYPDKHFDIVISSDSLEHMEFDERALKHWYRILKPGGHLIVFVPAFMALWSAHDIVNHHFRRYTKTELSIKIEKAGFNISKKGYWNLLLFLPIALIRLLKRGQLRNQDQIELEDDLSRTNPLVNRIFKILLRLENFLIRFLPFPFGVSTFCIAEKPAITKQ